MKNKCLLALVPFLLLGAGCSSVAEPPVSGSSPTKKIAKKPAAKAPATAVAPKKPAAGPNPTATYAIDSGPGSVKVEPNLPAFRAEPLMPPADVPPAQPGAAAPVVPVNPTTPLATVPAPRYAVEDAAIPSGTPPAVLALLSEADRSRNSGDLDAAVVVMERALRIDARNPTLTYKLAQLRLKQNKPQLAEELAGKAALLAGSNLDLKRKSWMLIAEARNMQQNPQGAKQAKAKAESFFGH
ncbi:tetratricopeptide repeat protein [Methylomonas sp. HW2-6]|uniref:tetratricopeptide repeat protein n=1 Tax=Methylomonas sp. HW2-6 TaxID=3376687 RepID=UPI004042AFF6